MRWLTDECVAPELVAALRREGHDVVAALESLRGSSDTFLAELAVRERRVLLTEDGDFGDLVFRKDTATAIAGIVRIRIPSERRALKISRLLEAVAEHGDQLLGHYTVIGEARVRFRPLPG